MKSATKKVLNDNKWTAILLASLGIWQTYLSNKTESNQKSESDKWHWEVRETQRKAQNALLDSMGSAVFQIRSDLKKHLEHDENRRRH